MDDIERDRAYQYAKYYHLTKNKPDYLRAIEKDIGKEYLKEAGIAWEAIDQWEGDVNPR